MTAGLSIAYPQEIEPNNNLLQAYDVPTRVEYRLTRAY
jgi:hypothetical protein